MGKLTTHVLDTAAGRPAAGVRIDLFAKRDGAWLELGSAHTNTDGRVDTPLLQGEALLRGRYRLVFHVGAYFGSVGQAADPPAFLDRVPIEFGIADSEAHYHVPLLVTPWSYCTYRGS